MNNKKLIFVACLLSLLPLTAAAHSIQLFPGGYWGPFVNCGPQGCASLCDLFDTGQHIIYFLMTLTLLGIGPVMIVAGGIMMLVAGGKPERFSKGRQIVTGAAIGIAISLGAFLIINTFLWAVAPPPGIINTFLRETNVEVPGITNVSNISVPWPTINCTPGSTPQPLPGPGPDYQPEI